MDCVMSVTGTVPQRPGQDSRALGWPHKGVCQLPHGGTYTQVSLHVHLPISSNIGPRSPVLSIKVITHTKTKQVRVVPRRRKSCSACCGIFCFPLSVPFSGVPIEESCRERRGDGMVAFPHATWNLTFLLPKIPECLSFFPMPLYHGPSPWSTGV